MPWFRLASCLTQDREIMVVRKVGGLWICFPGQKRQSGLGSNPNPVTYQLSGCGQVTSLDGASVSSSEKWAEFLSLRVLTGIQRVYKQVTQLALCLTFDLRKLLLLSLLLLPLPLPCPGTSQSSLPVKTYSRPPPPSSLPGLSLPVTTTPVVQTTQAHGFNYMLFWQNSCLPVLGCYLILCLYFKT